eukprot:Hpha_TRINITY_DN22820_c0_g1::TRINITY_DN22820_c0_g1_i1::g.84367::m.84367
MAAPVGAAMGANKWRMGVRALYRTMLKQVRLLSGDRRRDAFVELQAGFRCHSSLSEGSEEARAAVKKGFSQLGYLRTITPRIDTRARAEQQRERKYVWKDGQFVEGRGTLRQNSVVEKGDAPASTDPELRSRMEYEVQKDHFMGPYWKDKPVPEPLYNKPIDEVLEMGYRNAIGLPLDDLDDNRKLARNSVGSRGGVKMERARYPTAPWDIKFRGA